MKPHFRIAGIVFLTAVYCFALTLASSGTVKSAQRFKDLSGQNNYFSVATNGQFNHTLPTENLASSFSFYSVPVLKGQFVFLPAAVLISEHMLATAFRYYNFIETGLLINTRKADHIFPFHYFW